MWHLNSSCPIDLIFSPVLMGFFDGICMYKAHVMKRFSPVLMGLFVLVKPYVMKINSVKLLKVRIVENNYHVVGIFCIHIYNIHLEKKSCVHSTASCCFLDLE